MFEYYVKNNFDYKDVFIENQKIIKKLREKNIIKLEDLSDYELPSSFDNIIPKIEKLVKGEKLLTDAIADILSISSFLKVKNNIDTNYLLGSDYIVTNQTFYTTNPLSTFVKNLKKNVKSYNKNELLFSKIGYITTADLNKIKENEVNLKKEKIKDDKISNILIENIFIEILIKSIDYNASDFKVFYKNSTLKVVYSVNHQYIENEINTLSIEKYKNIVNYIMSMFKDNDTLMKDINNNNYKFKLNRSYANEENKKIPILNITLSNIKDENFDEIGENLSYIDKKLLEKTLKSPIGLFVLSSKKDLSDLYYSFINYQLNKNKNTLIYSIENSIKKVFDNVIQVEKENDDWLKSDFKNYSFILIDKINSEKELEKIFDLISEGKFIILGMEARNTIDAFSKLIKLTKNKELLADGLIGILHTDKIKKVCRLCSKEEEFIKEKHYSDFSPFNNVPTLNKLVKIEDDNGCEACINGFNGLIQVNELLENDIVLRSNILEKFDLKSFKIEKNSNDWENVFESALTLLNKGETTTNAIISDLGIPKK